MPIACRAQELGQPAESSAYAALMALQLRRRDYAAVFHTASQLPEETLTRLTRVEIEVSSSCIEAQDARHPGHDCAVASL